MENSSYGIKQVKFKGLRGELTISVLSTYFIVHVSHMQYIYIYMMKACSICQENECQLYYLFNRGPDKAMVKNKRKAEKLIEEVQIIKVWRNINCLL